MIRKDEEIDTFKLTDRLAKVGELYCGTKAQRDNNERIVPKIRFGAAVARIARAYMEAYWVETLDETQYDKSDVATLDRIQEIQMMVFHAIRNYLYERKKVGEEIKWVPVYSMGRADQEACFRIVRELSYPISCEELASAYGDKVNEKRFDEILTKLLKELWTVKDFDSAFKFFKLWMMNVKMKRFHSHLGCQDNWPKVPIWLAIRSPLHSIGKGFVVGGLRYSFTRLFNTPTKSVTLKELTSRFKGFANGNYICHIDEKDRVGSDSYDPNQVKNLVSENSISVEDKCVTNSRDKTNFMSFISTTNQSVRNMCQMVMETDRRFAEIEITDVCDVFKKSKMSYEELYDMCDELWLTCPFEFDEGLKSEDRLDNQVKKIIFDESSTNANTEWIDRYIEVAKIEGWGTITSTGFVPKTSGIQKIHIGKVKKTHDSIFGSGGGNFMDMAENKGVISTYKNGVYKIDFSKVADEVKAYRENRKDEEGCNDGDE